MSDHDSAGDPGNADQRCVDLGRATSNRAQTRTSKLPADARARLSRTCFRQTGYDPELPGVLRQITTPTVLLWGDEDKVTPVGQLPGWQ